MPQYVDIINQFFANDYNYCCGTIDELLPTLYLICGLECSREEAEVIYSEIALAEVKETMEQLLKDGIVRISGYNDEGEPLFVLTELGKQVKKELGNQ